jgi:secreted Zn-dependent insulinase-like peptidase
MKLTFQVPPQEKFYKEKSIYYLQQLYAHDAKGSISYHLQENGLATELSW